MCCLNRSNTGAKLDGNDWPNTAQLLWAAAGLDPDLAGERMEACGMLALELTYQATTRQPDDSPFLPLW